MNHYITRLLGRPQPQMYHPAIYFCIKSKLNYVGPLFCKLLNMLNAKLGQASTGQ